jgi:hypothetical protein
MALRELTSLATPGVTPHVDECLATDNLLQRQYAANSVQRFIPFSGTLLSEERFLKNSYKTPPYR